MYMLRKTRVLLGVVLLMGLAAACDRPASESDPVAPHTYALGDSIRVTGLLVDTRCFLLDKEANRNNDHNRPEGRVPACAQACARQGIPVAVLEGGDPEGLVWILGGYPSQIYADYMAGTVRVDGEFRSQGIIIPRTVAYKNGDTWTRIL